MNFIFFFGYVINWNLILDTKTHDDKNAVHGEKSDFLGQLTEKIRGCGVSFYIWTKSPSGFMDPTPWTGIIT
jgi:hypothetical protein